MSHLHDSSCASQNQGNSLGSRSCVRQSKYFRQYESGNAMKGILGTPNLAWDPHKKEGAYLGHKVYDADLGVNGMDRELPRTVQAIRTAAVVLVPQVPPPAAARGAARPNNIQPASNNDNNQPATNNTQLQLKVMERGSTNNAGSAQWQTSASSYGAFAQPAAGGRRSLPGDRADTALIGRMVGLVVVAVAVAVVAVDDDDEDDDDGGDDNVVVDGVLVVVVAAAVVVVVVVAAAVVVVVVVVVLLVVLLLLLLLLWLLLLLLLLLL
ncbi:unnamed protein product [Polarella glacialis]|uniref:Uncharacterized protein n=1 Tax=Polarella glacialis TaxID=89957 RepID=A0A813GHF0_POLGL|nr:unnamed protein product [Polarella glacialis]